MNTDFNDFQKNEIWKKNLLLFADRNHFIYFILLNMRIYSYSL